MEQLFSLIPLREIGAVVNSREFIVFWCAIIVTYFGVFLGLLLARALPLRFALRRVWKPLKDLEDPEGFAGRFEAYDQQVRQERFLRHAWNEFDESLIKPREGESQRVRNTREPSIFFNEDTVVQPVLHNRFLDSVPSQLMGLGVLGTFLGLAAGVGMAQQGLQSGTAQEVTDALGSLLSGASLAFVTSIFGLTSSLAFLWIERWRVGSVHRHLQRWVSRLEACVELVTPEQIALDQLEQQQRQTEQLERFNTELVFAIETALDEKVAQRLVPELERVVQAIDALRSDRADSNVSAMQRMVEEFTSKLTQSTGREMELMGSTLRDVSDRLQLVMAAIQESQDRTRELLDHAVGGARESLASGSAAAAESLRTVADEMARTLRDASADLTARVASAGSQMQETGQTAASDISRSLSSFSAGVARFTEAAAAQGELSGRIAEITESLRSAGEVMVQVHQGFQTSLTPVRDMTRSLDAAGTRVAGALEATQQLVDETTAAGRSLREENEKIASIWRSYEERFQGVDAALTTAFERLDEGMRRYAEMVREYLKEVDQEISKAVQQLGSAIHELQETLEDRSDAGSARP